MEPTDDIHDVSELEIFVPEFNLQGDFFPFYVISKNKIESIMIKYSEGLSPRELYNVVPESVELGDFSITIRRIKVEGYLGGLFNASFDEIRYGKSESISFNVKLGGKETILSRTIELFRPEIDVEPGKRVLNISTSYSKQSKTEKIKVDSPIQITNNGLGVSLISIETTGNAEVELTLPQDYANGAENLTNDLNKSMQELGEKYPDYKIHLRNLLEMMKYPIPTKESSLQYKESIKALDQILESNPEFKADFVSSFIGAIIRNISITREMETFLAYLMSIKPHKIILLNPLMNINLPEGTSNFDLIIRQTDLLKNFYDNIVINVSVNCNKEAKVPISDIFDFKKGDIK